MRDFSQKTFIQLFKEAYRKCFGVPLTNSLTETESKHFSNRILEETGLVIGAKSIKNYSFYVLDPNDTKKENPSIATLDTLSRYVLKAPYTSELERKEKEGHFPYWYEYKSLNPASPNEEQHTKGLKTNPLKWKPEFLAAIAGIAILGFFLVQMLNRPNNQIMDHFGTVQEDSLKNRGWMIKSKEETWWRKRGIKPGYLTLYTLSGDNWPDSMNRPVIKNLLLMKIGSDCFKVEIHLDSFMPNHNWQQAGILLLEDTTFESKSLRLTISYNDYFGGYSKPKEIIIQGITTGGNDVSKPEEIIHLPLFTLEPGQESLAYYNMRKLALKIEKTGKHFRLLYSSSPLENFAFKEALKTELSIRPNYIGIFALQGFVQDTGYKPAHFKYFGLTNMKCED